MNFTDVLDYSCNEITSMLFIIQTKEMILYNITKNEVEWSHDYRKEFAQELYGIPWLSENAMVRCIPTIDSWFCLFNKRYIKIVNQSFFISNFIDLEYQLSDISYAETFNLFLFSLANRKQLEVAGLFCHNFFENVGK